MAEPLAITLVNSTVTASGAGSAVDIGSRRSLLLLRATATEGDGSLEVLVESSADGVTGWHALRSVNIGYEPGYPGVVELAIDRAEQYVRVSWVLNSGTTITFNVIGAAHTIYATRDDLFSTQMPAGTFTDFDEAYPDAIPRALIGATADCEDALNVRYVMPLTAWPESLKERVGAIAAYRAMSARGFQPNGTDELIVKRYDDANKWLMQVATGKLTPNGFGPSQYDPVTSISGSVYCPEPKPRFQDAWGDF